MDQFEEDVFPREPEDTEQPAQTVADEPAAEEAAAEETLEEAASAEETVAEGPEPQPPYHCPPPPPPPPHRRSPYENAPYMMPHRPPHQGIPPVPPPPPPRPTPEQAEEPKKKRKGHPVRKTLLIVVVLLGSMAATAALTANYCQNYNNQMVGILQRQINELQEQLDARENVSSGESISGTPNTTIDGGLTPAQVYVQNEQSVVLIQTDVATGSGFILRSDGYVVTNYHVVEDAAKISVVLYDNTDCDAELVGYDDGNDLAVLKMEGVDFRPVTLGSSDDLIVGDQVVAIGNPLGELTSTLTVGYVSAKERDVYTDSSTINMIQTDCAINSGNSGGPLFNMNGEVVGITTAKYSGMSSSGASIEGIGFAIPIDDVAGLIEDLVDYGYVKGAYLGVSVYSVDAATAKMYNIPLGCLVDNVTKGSCADAAGIKDADVIIGLGGYEVDSYTDLVRALRKFEPGDTTTITVYRSGQELTFSITLDEKPHEEAAAESQSNMPESGSYEEWYNYFFGE